MEMSKVEVAQTLGELIKMGLVEAFTDEGQSTRYRLTGRPGDEDEQEQEETEAPARAYAVGA